MAALLEADIVIVRHAVITMDAKTLGEQQLGQMKANEASCARYEDTSHAVMLLKRANSRLNANKLVHLIILRGVA
ncbi:hypothetical protein GCM10016234_01950 [Tianweitania populi]|uniref:Uncharacterized protein n=1 Tax=Tianweitania populi TaxID=1607949 RepID=A0A8J3DKQ5_9HYPH|nr:hypothetical protein GCM10016234_01950 [Tianweitania populi]